MNMAAKVTPAEVMAAAITDLIVLLFILTQECVRIFYVKISYDRLAYTIPIKYSTAIATITTSADIINP